MLGQLHFIVVYFTPLICTIFFVALLSRSLVEQLLCRNHKSDNQPPFSLLHSGQVEMKNCGSRLGRDGADEGTCHSLTHF